MGARLRSETGTALATALAALAVVGVLTASFAAASVRLSDTSNASRDDKRALAAADAGLEAAISRINSMPEQVGVKCFTTAFVDPVDGVCPTQGPENLGNGASFSYHVTPVLDEGAICAGVPLTNAPTAGGDNTISHRCVTATGVAYGQTRRVQARVASYQGAPIMPVRGVLGLQYVSMGNNASIEGYIGSNGQVTLGTNATVSVLELAERAPNPIIGNGASIGTLKRRDFAQGDFVVAPIEFGNSATVNDNARITNGLDTKSGSVTYDAATRALSINGSLTLGGSTYNFCRITMDQGAQLNLAPGAMVRMYVDSPDRDGGNCVPSGMTASQARQAGYGSMSLGNNATFNNTGHADSLQFYVYGWHSTPMNSISFNNSAVLKALVYAPRSVIVLNNTSNNTANEQLRGGLVAGAIDVRNNTRFRWDESLEEVRADTVAHWVRTAWSECQRRATSATDPGSGCATG